MGASTLIPLIIGSTVLGTATTISASRDAAAAANYNAEVARQTGEIEEEQSLVEVIQGEKSDPEIVEETIQILQAVGKTAVHAKKDIPGFINVGRGHDQWCGDPFFTVFFA